MAFPLGSVCDEVGKAGQLGRLREFAAFGAIATKTHDEASGVVALAGYPGP